MKKKSLILLICMLVCWVVIVMPGAASNEGKIAFCSEWDGNSEIYVMNTDGTNQVRLTFNTENDYDPSWSPDGMKIAFASYRDGNPEIYTMNADGTNQKRITNNTTWEGLPAWSPDSARIAFTSDRDGVYEIYVMNTDGTNQIRLTNDTPYNEGPAWSPDGSKIVFQSSRDSNFEIYTMNADGTNQVRLTNNAQFDLDPVWSPDGGKIVFTRGASVGFRQTYTMNTDGTNQICLSDNSANDLDPAWSPDGSKIVFVSDRDGNDEIYTMNADGTSPVRLTTTTAREGTPAWTYGESITVAVPNGGETFYLGTTLPISWKYTGNPGSTVKIEVLKGGSLLKVLPGISIGSGGSGSHNVTIPSSTPLSAEYAIRVTSTSTPAITDTSDGPFAISGPTINLTIPNGGETFFVGSPLSMNWTYQGNPGTTVKIEVLKGGSILKVISGIPIGSGGSGSYSVPIPSSTPLGSDYRIRITSTSNPAFSDTSNADFTIVPDSSSSITVVSPNGGENWTQGSLQTLRWNYTGTPGSMVRIEALRSGSVLATVTSGYPIGSGGSGSYNLTFPYNTPVGSDYQFRVTSTSNPGYTDTSDAMFRILPAIRVVSPNGGENYALGSLLSMNWTSTGDPGDTVMIEVFKGAALLKTLTGIPIGPAGSGSLQVTIPNTTPVGPDYTIRVTSTSYPACRDTSDAGFSIGAMAATFQGILVAYQSLSGGGYFLVNITNILDDEGGILHPGDQVTIRYASGLPPEYQQEYEIDPGLEVLDTVEVFCTIFGADLVLRDGNYVKGVV